MAMIDPFQRRVLSPPIKCRWMGWESDTYTLQRHGWRIAAEEDPYYDAIRIAISHPDGNIMGLSNIEKGLYHSIDMRSMRDGGIPLVFNMRLANSLHLHSVSIDPIRFVPIDATPGIEDVKVTKLEDLNLFQPMVESDRDLIVTPPSLTQILNMALSHQAPRQKELREKARHQLGAIIRVAA